MPSPSPASSLAPPPSELSVVERAKREAARRAVDDYVPRVGASACSSSAGAGGGAAPFRLGMGSGSTILYAIQRVAERVQDPGEKLSVVCVPTSFNTRILLAQCGVPLAELPACPELDVAVDGADEFERGSLDCVKGGGACMLQEKLVAVAAKVFVLVADSRKLAPEPQGLLAGWRKGVPLEVVPFGYEGVMRAVAALGGVPALRLAGASKAGPCITDNGLMVIDADFGGGAGLAAAGFSPRALHEALKLACGVVETGIFAGLASRAYVGNEDVSLTRRALRERLPPRPYIHNLTALPFRAAAPQGSVSVYDRQ